MQMRSAWSGQGVGGGHDGKGSLTTYEDDEQHIVEEERVLKWGSSFDTYQGASILVWHRGILAVVERS